MRMQIPTDWRSQLLSSNGQQLDSADELPCRVLVTDLGPLRKRRSITEISKTEERGITLAQLQELMAFLEAEAEDGGKLPWRGQQDQEILQVKLINLYDLTHWVIKPATSSDACSYVELVADPQGQIPRWFVSHAWAEAVNDFVACVQRHSTLRQLAETDAWWVCAYANNQHELGKDLTSDPRSTSFFRAMSLCEGLLLILDHKATPFQRIWCCFEQSVALTSTRAQRMLLDIATAEQGSDSAVIITDGVTKMDLQEKARTIYRNTHGYEDSVKAHREAQFPISLILQALTLINVKKASASQALDKVRILNSICHQPLDAEPLDSSPFYDEVDRGLRSIFALAALPACAKGGQARRAELELIAEVVQKDTADRDTLNLNLTDMKELTDDLLGILAAGIPGRLHELTLHLTRCEQLTDLGVKALCPFIPKTLSYLVLSLHACGKITDTSVQVIGSALPSGLKQLRLSFGNCERLTDASLRSIAFPPGLELLRVDLDNISSIGDEALISISRAMPGSLTSLTLNFMGCHGVGDKGLDALASKLPKTLRFLELTCFACHHLTDRGSVALAQTKLPALRELLLDLRGTQLTEQSLLRMAEGAERPALEVLDWYFPKGDLHEHLDSLAALQAWLDARHTAAPAETPGALAGAAGPALLKAKKLP
ncbi:unnamed protein product [Durusdinium trenchii]|uniref:Uncharacterized protein n=1 Tax=Durusdinium trenchii TaxID=1381693 RepID=A0ABP0HAG3_9DINO